MVRKNQDPFAFDETKPTRFGVLPRYAKDESEIRWFDFSTSVIFHNGMQRSPRILYHRLPCLTWMCNLVFVSLHSIKDIQEMKSWFWQIGSVLTSSLFRLLGIDEKKMH
jgi:hypothetical protein